MWKAVKNVVNHAGIDLDEALRMASTYPAMVIDQGHRWGKIAVGYDAAMVVFDGDGSGSVELIQHAPGNVQCSTKNVQF